MDLTDVHLHPVVKVYFGVIEKISSPDGDCSTLKFSGTAFGSWDHRNIYQFNNLKADNLLSCDVKNRSPEIGDPCEIWVVPQTDGSTRDFLILKTHQIIFDDCG